MNSYKYVAKASVPGRYLMIHKARIVNRRRAIEMCYGYGRRVWIG